MAATLLGVAAGAAQASFPGENGRIAFTAEESVLPSRYSIFTMASDGSDVQPVVLDPPRRGDGAWSSDGTKLAYRRGVPQAPPALAVVNADGSNDTVIAPDAPGEWEPAWSPDGAKIAFRRDDLGQSSSGIYVVPSTGGTSTQLTSSADGPAFAPSWSPDGTRIAFSRPSRPSTGPGDVPDYEIWVMNADGSNEVNVTMSPTQHDRSPDWSPDGSRIVFQSSPASGQPGTVQLREFETQTGTNSLLYGDTDNFFSDPDFSPDGTKILFTGAQGDLFVIDSDGTDEQLVRAADETYAGYTEVDWQPLPVETVTPHVRPIGATPFRVPLVPAYEVCTSPNREHGPPLAFGSCSPPTPGSSRLTIGVGDGSPAFARGDGFLRMDVVTGVPGPPDDSDVGIRFRVTNVMRTSDLSEYTGEVRAELTVRRTDRDPPGAAPHSTSMDFPFGFTVPCTPTPGSSLDASNCIAFTSANAIVPLAIEDAHRAIWEIDKFRVYDGGPDEDADTDAGRSLFMTQGVFVP